MSSWDMGYGQDMTNRIDHDLDWRLNAKCLGDEPTRYELDQVRGIDKHERALELCAGCKVVQECALEAANPVASGTVRAGLWLSGGHSHIYRKVRGDRDRLLLVATGELDPWSVNTRA